MASTANSNNRHGELSLAEPIDSAISSPSLDVLPSQESSFTSTIPNSVHSSFPFASVNAEAVAQPEGLVYFPPEQAALYDALFTLCDVKDHGAVTGAQASLVLRMFKLSDATLRQVWKLAGGVVGSKISKPRLDRGEILVLLRLIALTQEKNGFAPLDRDGLFLPNSPMARVDLFDSNPIPLSESITVQVFPGESRFREPTWYRLQTETSSDRFGRRSFETFRRYSDFDFLRQALVSRIGSDVCIPVLPPKRILFNSSPEFVAASGVSFDGFKSRLEDFGEIRKSESSCATLCSFEPQTHASGCRSSTFG